MSNETELCFQEEEKNPPRVKTIRMNKALSFVQYTRQSAHIQTDTGFRHNDTWGRLKFHLYIY